VDVRASQREENVAAAEFEWRDQVQDAGDHRPGSALTERANPNPPEDLPSGERTLPAVGNRAAPDVQVLQHE
jgi:hypothetical protein